MTQQKIRLLTIDPHPLICEGIAAIISRQPDMEVVAEARSGQEGLELFRRLRPDVTLTEVLLPDMSGVQITRTICGEFAGSQILILTMCHGDEDIYQAFQAGARGYVLKHISPEELVSAIRMMHDGNFPLPPLIAARLAQRLHAAELTSRERDVLDCIMDGESNKEIAARLFISEGTVKVHVNNLMSKLGAENRTQVVIHALRRGIVHLDRRRVLTQAQ